MSTTAAWRRRRLADACDLQRAHLHDLIGIHRRQVDNAVDRASLVAGLAVQGLRLYRAWRRPTPPSGAPPPPSRIRLAVDAALAVVDCWRSYGGG